MKQHHLIATVLFVSILFTGLFGILLGEKENFSVQENRSLQGSPKFTAKRLFSGDYSQDTDAFFSDQFLFRDRLVGWKGRMEISMGKGECNGILLGTDGRLARRLGDVLADGACLHDCDAVDEEQVKRACRGIQRIGAALGDRFTVLLTGRNIDVTASAFSYPNAFGEALERWLKRELEGVSTVETVPLLREKFEDGEEVYFRTDHHWTARGAYYAYVEVMRQFGLESQIIPEERFEKRRVTDAFCGSLWSAGGMKWVAPDCLELWLLGNEEEFRVTADGKPSELYSRRWLSRKDCYSVFLDGVHDVITVEKPDEERPRLLLLKDSFANSLAPFLAQHFDLVLLNLSSTARDFTHLSALSDEWDADRCLLVYTLENLISADRLSRLR